MFDRFDHHAYYAPQKDNLRKVTPFKDPIFVTALETKGIIDELLTVQKQLYRADFMFNLIREYQQRGFDANLIIDLMRRLVPQVFSTNVKTSPTEPRLLYKRILTKDGLTILFGYVEEPNPSNPSNRKKRVYKKRPVNTSGCPSILGFI